MKKFVSLLLAFSLALCLAACGGSASSAVSGSAASSEAASSEAASSEAAQELSTTDALRIAGLKGPTTMGLVNLLSMEEREGKSFLAKYFADHWASEGLRTRIVRHGVDFETNDKKYIRAQRLSDFWELNSAEQIPDILPLAVLKQADFNLLIANACRLWGKNDDINLKSIKEMLGDTPLSLYLNNADREVVESFTGELPPKTPLHSFVSRLSQLGLTAKKAAVK